MAACPRIRFRSAELMTMIKKYIDLDAIRQLLRASGLRATPARIAILDFLNRCDHPATHHEVAEDLTGSGFDKSTILRALAELTRVSLLRRLELGDRIWRFERLGNRGRFSAGHPHLLCIGCGSVQCLSDDQVELKASRSVGRIEDVLLKGHCGGCRSDAN